MKKNTLIALQVAQFVDLTHPLNPSIQTWEGSCGLHIVNTNDYDNIFRVQKITMNAGLGTHIDFPAHIVPGGLDASQVPFQTLQAPCSVLYAHADNNAEFILTKQDIEIFEKDHGSITPHSWLIVMFGWGNHWFNQALYRNADSTGTMRFPKIDPGAAELLIERQIIGLGVDTLSADGGDCTAQFPLHKDLLSKNIFLLENLKYEAGLPAQGGHLLVSHLPLEKGTESPARVIFYHQF